MTQETLEKAKLNREICKEKLDKYNEVSYMHNELPKDKVIWLDVCVSGAMRIRIHPTNQEFKDLMKIIRDRLDAEIAELDREFESL